MMVILIGLVIAIAGILLARETDDHTLMWTGVFIMWIGGVAP